MSGVADRLFTFAACAVACWTNTGTTCPTGCDRRGMPPTPEPVPTAVRGGHGDVYVVPVVSPVTVAPVAGGLPLDDRRLRRPTRRTGVTVYDVIGLPPSAGADHSTDARTVARGGRDVWQARRAARQQWP